MRFERTEYPDGYLLALEETIFCFGAPGSTYSNTYTIFFSPKPGKLTPQGKQQSHGLSHALLEGSQVDGP